MNKELAIVIPVYNEQDAIEEVINQWLPVAKKCNGSLIFINDGSRDNSKMIIEKHISTNEPIILIDQKNSGHGASCLNGYQYALDNGFQWIFQTDSDGQTSPEDFNFFWDSRNKSPLIFGRRYNRGDGFHRKIISFVLKMAIFFIFGKLVQDANVPFRLMRRDLLQSALKQIPQGLFLTNAYLTVVLGKQNKIQWEPIQFLNRETGTPSINFLKFFKVGFQVIREFSRILPKSSNKFPLEIITIIYLTIPLIIFILGWLNWFISIPLFLVFSISTYRSIKKYEFSFSISKLSISTLVIIILTTLWVYLSGAGNLSFQNGDYQKHNAMLFDLISMPWPVAYTTGSSLLNLVYYFGHYLFAGALGKLFGVVAAHKIFFVWTLAGVYLSLCWFFRLIGKSSIALTLLFIFFSGMDVIGITLTPSTIPLLSSGTAHIEWWAGYGFWQYSSNTAALYWTPQHAVSAWLLTSLFISNKKRIPIIFLFALSALWSPFVMLGLIPFLFLELSIKVRDYLNLETITGLLLLLILGLYYKSNLMHHRSYFIFQVHNLLNVWPTIVAFYLLEFGTLCMIIFTHVWNRDRLLFLITLATLLLIPWYIFGHYNDFGMRSSLPALFALQILVGKFLVQTRGFRPFLICCLIIGSVTAGMEISRSIKLYKRGYSKKRHVTQIQPFVASQYMGSNNSFFFKYLAKKSVSTENVPRDILQKIRPH